MIPDNQLAKGIQSKNILRPEGEPTVGGKAPQEPGDLGRRGPSNVTVFALILMKKLLHTFQMMF